MDTISIVVHGEIRFPDILALAKVIAGKAATASAPEASASVVPHVVATVPIPDPAAIQTPTVTTAPPAAPAAAPAPAPIQTPPPAPAPTPAPTVAPAPSPAIPTSAPKYGIDDIARAGAMLAQQGPEKLAALNGLLQQFGLQSLTQLPQEQTAAFVQAMRGLGAQI